MEPVTKAVEVVVSRPGAAHTHAPPYRIIRRVRFTNKKTRFKDVAKAAEDHCFEIYAAQPRRANGYLACRAA